LTVYFTYRSWRTFEAQLGEMQKVYGPIEKSANAAKDAAETAKSALIDVQRAFVFVSDVTTLPTVSDDGKPTLRIFPKWTNSGSTPTKRLNIFSFCGADTTGFDFHVIQGDDASAAMLGPKETKAHGNCDATPQKVELRSGLIMTFAVGGKATFYDVFDATHKHVSEFCATFPVTQIYNAKEGTVVMSVGGTFTYCPKPNCADEECLPEDRQ
jgi:hypothetical protein